MELSLILLFVLAAFVAGVTACWLITTWRTDPKLETPRRLEPLEHDEYLKRRGGLVDGYNTSMKEYDRLVTWISAGALALSVTFAEKVGLQTSPRYFWLLGCGWALLGVTLLTSLISQYTSTRIHTWKIRELEHLQATVEERAEDWSSVALALERKARFYADWTKRLNVVVAPLLVGGLMSLAVFAFTNLPILTNTNESRDGNRRTQVYEVPEKRGLEDLGEPLPRPAADRTPRQPVNDKPAGSSDTKK